MSKDIYDNPKDAEFFAANTEIKKKVGSGGIPEVLLQRAQESIDDNHAVDFRPFAEEYLGNIEGALERLATAKIQADFREVRKEVSENIMQLKANGGMFGYYLVSMVSDVALNFADTETDFNDDFVKIIHAHNNSVRLILDNKIKGSGGRAGDALIEELRQAISRFHKKYAPKD